MVRGINGTEVELATIMMMFGDSQKCEQVVSMLLEEVDKKEHSSTAYVAAALCCDTNCPVRIYYEPACFGGCLEFKMVLNL